MKYYLSIDGGGTKTKAVLIDENYTVLYDDTFGRCNYVVSGKEVITEILEGILSGIEVMTGLKQTDISQAFFAVAGFNDIPEDVEIIENMVATAFPNLKITLGNDTENALVGSLGGKDGINIVCGTGSIGLGVNEKGEYIRSGGWHHLFGGDEGSGYWIACKLILNYTRQSDGRDKKTLLYEYMNDKYDLKDDSDILKLIIYEWEESREKIAGLAKEVYELAKLNDEVATNIYKNAAKELADIAIAIKKQIANDSEEVLVSYSGGVFNAEHYILVPFEEILKQNNMKLVKPLYSPVVGGLIIATKLDGVVIPLSTLEQLNKIL